MRLATETKTLILLRLRTIQRIETNDKCRINQLVECIVTTNATQCANAG